MVLGFILVMLVVGIGISLSIHSMFLPFRQDIGDIKFYNSAYYGAIAGLERGLLTVRYHEPGFESSGGYLGTNKFGPESDHFSGTTFGSLTDASNGIYWKIKSRSNSIPSTGNGNINMLFASGSEDFNQMDYYSPQKFFLYLDNTSSSSGTKIYDIPSSIDKFTGNQINVSLRLNPTIYEYIKTMGGNYDSAKLDTNSDLDGDGLSNDSVVYWYRKGNYNNKEFLIMPIDDTKYYNGAVKGEYDSMVRESVINEIGNGTRNISNIRFAGTTNPIYDSTIYLKPIRQNTISEESDNISGDNFTDILTNNNYSNLSFGFSLTNFLTSQYGQIYPFLEYKINTSGSPIADRFFDINTVGKAFDYNIRINLKKPTSKEGIGSDFTIIF